MTIPAHLFVNTIIAVSSKQYLGWSWRAVAIFILAGILIDIDHLFYFFFKCKSLNLKEWISFALKLRKKMQPGLYVFHSFEFNAILFLASFFNGVILIILLSNIIHVFLDAVEHYRYHKNFSWVRKWSLIYLILL